MSGGIARKSGFKQRIFWSLVALCLVVSGYQMVRYQREQRWLSTKGQEIVRAASAQSREDQIVALRDYIRRHVTTDGLAIEDRPFLRETAQEVLESGQGYCGEATRAFIGLARHLGIAAQRVNLHGRVNHVVAETELKPGSWTLVDVQTNSEINGFLDRRWRTLDEAIVADHSPFNDYSNLNLRRLPFMSLLVQRIKLNSGWVSWAMENPPLIKASLSGGLAFLLMGVWGLDQLLLRLYAHRLAVAYIPSRGRK